MNICSWTVNISSQGINIKWIWYMANFVLEELPDEMTGKKIVYPKNAL